jgi:hyperosmotically inducible periplasmic protein
MKISQDWRAAAVAACAALALSACDREATNRAAADTAQKVDNAIDKTQQKLAEAGDKLGPKLQQAGAELKPKLESAGEKISEAAEKTGEKISETAQRATSGMKDSTVDNTRTTATTSAPNGNTTTVTTGEKTSISGISDDTRAKLSDGAITASIKADYLKDPDLSVLKIDVDTTGGVVTLKGTAADDAARQRAEKIASAIKGVREVRNNLEVKRG